ncbi:exosortase A [Zoogloea sp. LCSB751]|uniref:exosortase A n=1 Tax=Zoogloea sp. LCSB751 TaxID=1965277 RepID=UPI00111748A8|nr:exosortase A [Zoogloea sp. LCSB751]
MKTSVRHILIALGVVFAWVVAWYHGTAAEILEIWWRSETFAHGLLVLPISAWLVWRSRDRLVGEVLRPCWIMSVPILLAGMAWLLGELASVASVTHAALALLLIFSLVGVLGLHLSRVLAFPILFLFFGVPIGEFLLPIMMKYTAMFTVAAVRTSGVPVYQEGLHFVVPNGRWSVVEACSGVRYLIASLMVGTLYAYLSYRSLKRRLLFVACALVVPIVANWLRAYMIVMLGYLSDNNLATGVDHILYGWLFFGIVIMLMFWIGGRWREDLTPIDALREVQTVSVEKKPEFFALVLRAAPIAIAVAVWPLLLGALERTGAAQAQVASAVPVLNLSSEWSETTSASDDFKPSFIGFQQEALRHFTDGRHEVSVYVAVYAQQGSGRELVHSSNQLLQPSDNNWSRLAEGGGPDSGHGSWLHSVLAGRNRQVVALSGYWIDGRLVTNDYVAKALLALTKLQGRPDTSAYVAVWASGLDEQRAEEQLKAFQRENGKNVLEMLSRLNTQG